VPIFTKRIREPFSIPHKSLSTIALPVEISMIGGPKRPSIVGKTLGGLSGAEKLSQKLHCVSGSGEKS
jgi:hypothetical protein